MNMDETAALVALATSPSESEAYQMLLARAHRMTGVVERRLRGYRAIGDAREPVTFEHDTDSAELTANASSAETRALAHQGKRTPALIGRSGQPSPLYNSPLGQPLMPSFSYNFGDNPATARRRRSLSG
jgi:hypothetical protein